MKFKSRSVLVQSLRKQPPPFSGEEVTCNVCSLTVQSDPNVSLGWRCFETDTRERFFACANCRPANDAGTEEWKSWILTFFRDHIASRSEFKPVQSLLYWRERGEGPPVAEQVM